jgi:hypothetical protein
MLYAISQLGGVVAVVGKQGPGRNYFLGTNDFILHFWLTQYKGPGTIIRQGPRQEFRPFDSGQADPVVKTVHPVPLCRGGRVDGVVS